MIKLKITEERNFWIISKFLGEERDINWEICLSYEPLINCWKMYDLQLFIYAFKLAARECGELVKIEIVESSDEISHYDKMILRIFINEQD